MRFWIIQAFVALLAVAAASVLTPACNGAPTLGLCNGQLASPTCAPDTDTSGQCETSEDCGGAACCDGLCTEARTCALADGGHDGGPADAHED